MKKSYFTLMVVILTATALLFCNSGNTKDNNDTGNNTANNNIANNQNNNGEQNHNTNGDKKSATTKDIARSNNVFAMDIFNSIEKEVRSASDSDTQNIFISPMSIFVALAMTDNGAGGPLREGISKTLHINDYDMNSVNEGLKQIMVTLEEKGRNIDLLLANSIWQQDGFPVLENFKQTLTTYYDALIETVNFGDPKTKDIINQWISDNTNDLIKNMISKTSPDDVMYLINAIYFYGQWLRKFDKDITQDQSFYPINGNPIDVPMMRNEGDYMYHRGKGFDALRLSYGQLEEGLSEDEMEKVLFKPDEYVSMYILLPSDRSNVYSMIDSLDPKVLENVFRGMRPQQLKIAIPKFKIDFGGDYKEILDNLSALGMPSSNDFSNLTSSPQGLFISKVLHQAVVEVNEEGTEAAAATVVEVARGGMGASEFIADRPFLFIIRDDKTGVILFMGVLKDPTQTE